MAQEWKDFLWNIRLADFLDIAIVACLIAFVLQWWTRRRKPSLLIGIVLLMLLYGAAISLELYLLRSILLIGFPVLVFSLLVLFQEELRFELERLRAWRFRHSSDVVEQELIHMLGEAAVLLASQRIGALVVLPQRQAIERFTRAGIQLDALPSVPLIHSLFHPDSQGHDGALVVGTDRLLKFGVHLPLSADVEKIGQHGTRHTAALGLVERTDAVVLVVSEETGTISIAHDGQLLAIRPEDVSQQLSLFVEDSSSVGAGRGGKTWGRAIGTAILALCISVMAWYLFAFRVQTVQRTIGDVVVELHRVPDEVNVEGPIPGTVSVTLAGPQRVLDGMDPAGLRAIIDMPAQGDQLPWVRISRRHIQLPTDVELLSVEPEYVRVE